MSNWHRIKLFLQSNHKELKFLLLFILYFVLGQAIYYVIQPHISPLLVDVLHVDLSSKVINAFTPAEKTHSVGTTLMGAGGIQVRIAKGCEGVEGLLLVITAICAFNARFRQKTLGLVAGILTIYCANITRIILLYYTIKYKPALFDAMHL